jgi:hypothetical protein
MEAHECLANYDVMFCFMPGKNGEIDQLFRFKLTSFTAYELKKPKKQSDTNFSDFDFKKLVELADWLRVA